MSDPAATRKEPCFAWPSRECWIAFAYYLALLTALWIVVYGGACWVTSLHGYRVPLQVKLDLEMPFVPAAIVVYLSLFPMMWLAPFVLHTRERLRVFAQALVVLFLCSGIGFLLLPSEEVRSTPVMDGLVGSIFRFADHLNLSFNNLPCLHVGMATLCAYFFSQDKSMLATGSLWLWAIAISLSTLVTHQHYIADVIAGAGLAILIARYSSRLRPRCAPLLSGLIQPGQDCSRRIELSRDEHSNNRADQEWKQ